MATSSMATSSFMPPSPPGVGIRHGHFVDPQGRVQILRGVNLGGSSKLPTGYGHADEQDFGGFFDGAPHVSFVGRPFPLEDADEHFSRLRRWGLTCVRLIVTWEAIEHEGPKMYDRAYLSYVRSLVAKAARFDLLVYIDPHQDVWSRWTGGDGAPLWTLESVGLEPRRFAATKAALCLETSGWRASQFPKMIWPTNYFKLACATMFTLFYAGDRFAPSCCVDGVPVQQFLQSHYLDAMAELARSLVGLRNVVGIGAMNEPSSGFVGLADLDRHFHHGELKYDYCPTPFQGMCLADGIPTTVERWSNGLNQHILGRPDSRETVDPCGARAWQDGVRCVWRTEGVWDVDAITGTPRLLRPDYFAGVDFGRDCCLPFAVKFAERIRTILPDVVFFVELPPLEFSIDEFPDVDPVQLPNAANATHWYDGVTLFLQRWTPFFTVDPRSRMPAFGRGAVARMHQRQLLKIREYGRVQMRGAPTLIGETGIPFNLNGARAFATGDYRAQVDAMDNTVSCLEENLLSYTLWCYTPDNCHDYGDLWNREDLSLISVDTAASRPLVGDTDDRDDCGRATRSFVRPHPLKIAGIPSRSRFLLDRARYELEFDSDFKRSNDRAIGPTEVYVPHLHYPKGYSVTVSDGAFSIETHDGWDVVRYEHSDKTARHSLVVTSNDQQLEIRRLTREWVERVATVAVLALVIVVIYFIAR